MISRLSEGPRMERSALVAAALTSADLPATLPAMNTMKFLLGATVALLFGAIVVSWQGMKQNVKNATPEELAVVKQQLEELKQELAASKLAQTAAPAAPAPELQAMQAELLAALFHLSSLQALGMARAPSAAPAAVVRTSD